MKNEEVKKTSTTVPKKTATTKVEKKPETKVEKKVTAGVKKQEEKKQDNKTVRVLVLLVIMVVSMTLGWLFTSLMETKCDVTFSVGNGLNNIVVSVEKDNLLLKPADPEKDGYTFEGWYYNGSKFDFSTPITKDIVITAVWSENNVQLTPDSKPNEELTKVTYTVAFDSNGGSSVTAQTIVENELAIEPTKPTRSGYKFNGWYNGGTKFDFSTAITANVTLTAKWTKAEKTKTEDKKEENKTTVTKYTVKFDYGYSNKVTTKSIEKGKLVSEITPTRSGYTFLGWYYNGEKFNFSTKITKNITLTAKWSKIEETKPEDKEENHEEIVTKYTVKFDYGYSNKVTTESVEKGKTVSEITPTRSGYTFLGWYYNGEKFNFSTKITRDITLTAKWKADDVITWTKEKVPNSVVNQVRVYILLNGKKVSGTADVVNTQGQTLTKSIPASGWLTVDGTISTLKNIKVN